MNRYEHIPCPICGKPFTKDDDIVVCPICGAPYHRACLMEKGACIFPELHESHTPWTPPQPESDAHTASDESSAEVGRTCPRCGAENPNSALFCNTCGTPLSMPNQSNAQTPPYSAQQGTNGMPQGFGPMPFGMFAQAQSVPPEEEIEGIQAQDYAAYIGRNAHYFLLRFRELARSKTKIINWSAFFFQGGYFLYRKMYGTGILIFLIQMLISLPQYLMTYQAMTSASTLMPSDSFTSITTISMICQLLALAMRFVCGFFANTLYMRHCQKHIAKARAVTSSPEECRALLAKKGSVATKLIAGLLIAYAAVNVLAFFMLLFFL